MDLAQLRVLQRIADLGGLAPAARRLHLSRSAVSLQIKRLEEELGVPLLERHGRVGASLTAEGEVVLGYAGRMLDLAEALAAELRARRRGDAGTVRLGATLTAHGYLLPPLLHEFRPGQADVRIDLTGGRVPELLETLDRGRIDLAVVWAPVDPALFDHLPLAADELIAIAPSSHPFACRAAVAAAELRDQPVLLNAPHTATRAFLDARLRQAGTHLRHTIELGTPAAIKEAVLAGLGIGFLSPHAVRRELGQGQVARVPLSGLDLRRHLVLAWRRGDRLSPAAERLATFLRERLG